jgi:hypothetical protein
MDTRRVDGRLAEARRALEAADWDRARASFEAELEADPSPDARDGLGLALWFVGDVTDGIAARAEAFEEYVRDGRCDEAARVAVWVSHQHLISGRASGARGWWRFDSAEHYVVFMETYYGPLLKARERLTAEGRWEDCRGEILAMAERRNEATDGSLFMHAECLVAAGRKVG